VHGPADRGLGALLGGAKGIAIVWVLLSALALAGDALPRRLSFPRGESQLADLARDHNLFSRAAPGPGGAGGDRIPEPR
jgi:membrane protein required for colicin V production